MSGKLPVIVAPGFFTSFWPSSLSLVEKLRYEGYDVVSPEASLMSFLSIHIQAVVIKKMVDETLKKYRVKKCDIIGISMGGIAALYYLHELGGAEKVNTFIAIGAPFRGTWAGLVGVCFFGAFSPSVWEILPNSLLLRYLANKPKPKGVKIFTIIGSEDKISPPDSCYYKNTRCKLFIGGHAEICLGLNGEVLKFIKLVLAAESPR